MQNKICLEIYVESKKRKHSQCSIYKMNTLCINKIVVFKSLKETLQNLHVTRSREDLYISLI